MNHTEQHILVTNAQSPIGSAIVRRYAERGSHVFAHIEPERASGEHTFTENVTLLHASSATDIAEEAITRAGFVNCCVIVGPEKDEAALWNDAPDEIYSSTMHGLQNMFLLSRRIASHMIERKSGSIVFPIVYDSLAYDGYPTSPIMDHAKIVFAKSIAKELHPFRIMVNVATIGHFDRNDDAVRKRELIDSLEIYHLKPRLRPLEDVIAPLDIFVNQRHGISGQNIHFTPGMEFNL
jgi:NAD(P)-dependent dehydrogenase (short-subunit alcohol dehydrogenase family)